MNLSETISPELAPKVESLELGHARRVRARRPALRQGLDGRILRGPSRSWDQVVVDFWSRVKIGGLDECWEWQAGRNSRKVEKSYGSMWDGTRKWYAHVFAYIVCRGPVPIGLYVCHHCDNPPCCNPFHLFAGTAKDNMQDCLSKGRANRPFGERATSAKLTEIQVKEIRAAYVYRSRQFGTTKLAVKYGVAVVTIENIIKLRKWRHVI